MGANTNRTNGRGASAPTTTPLYGGIVLSEMTKQKRAQIKQLKDDFMTFAWGGCDAFETFGAFILNDKKGSLKFYNGPGFSNEYTKPQFNTSAGELLGVSFNKQTIAFTIGVYWISIEDYRVFLNWLNPNVVDYLYFGYESKYRYNVKLSKIADSTKWIVGSELVDGKTVPMYYTEIALTFEVQGEPCAKGFYSYLFGEAEGFTWKDDYTYTPQSSSSNVLVQSNSEKTPQTKINGLQNQTFIFDGESSIPFWCTMPWRSQWDRFLGYSKSIECHTNGELILQKMPNNKNKILCANSHMELTQWAPEWKAAKLTEATQPTTSETKKTVVIADNSLINDEDEYVINNTKEFFHKPFYTTKDVYVYTFDTVEVNGCAQPRWFVTEIYTEDGVDKARYIGRDPNPADKTTCIKITASQNTRKIIYFQLPASRFNANGYLKDPSNFVAWSKNTNGTNHERFHGWKLNFEISGDEIVPYYYNVDNTYTNAAVGTTSFYCDYPVRKNSRYKITGKTDWPLPHFMVLDSEKNLEYAPEQTGSAETREIIVEKDGFIRLQCFKNHIYGYGAQQVKLELIPNPVWKTVGPSTDPTKQEFEAELNTAYDFIPSDLDTPFEVNLPFNICQNDNTTDATYEINLKLQWGSDSISLFNVVLYNLTHYAGYSTAFTKTDLILLGVKESALFEGIPGSMPTWDNNQTLQNFISTNSIPASKQMIIKQNIQEELMRLAPKLNLTYNSMNGVLYLKTGSSNDKILNLLTLNDRGERIVKSSSVYKAKIPGRFSIPDFYSQEVKLKLTITKRSITSSSVVLADEFVYNLAHEKAEVICFPRTNIA